MTKYKLWVFSKWQNSKMWWCFGGLETDLVATTNKESKSHFSHKYPFHHHGWKSLKSASISTFINPFFLPLILFGQLIHFAGLFITLIFHSFIYIILYHTLKTATVRWNNKFIYKILFNVGRLFNELRAAVFLFIISQVIYVIMFISYLCLIISLNLSTLPLRAHVNIGNCITTSLDVGISHKAS